MKFFKESSKVRSELEFSEIFLLVMFDFAGIFGQFYAKSCSPPASRSLKKFAHLVTFLFIVERVSNVFCAFSNVFLFPAWWVALGLKKTAFSS